MSIKTSLTEVFLVICKKREFFFPDADILDNPQVKVKVKVKGKFHPITGAKAQRRSRGIARWEWVTNATSRPL
jgi:hypothetical protein